VESFREGLKQTGISQDELNAKVGEFRQIMFEKIKWEPITKGVQELQQIFTSTFSSISDTIAKTFVEGTKNIQDFVDIGKKLLEELISKLIEMLIFNNLFNALTGATGSASLPTITSAGLGQLFHAKGAILNKPTIVGKSGKKMDVGGEAGPEGLLPLARTSSGDLGVKAIGMGTSSPAQVFLDVNVYNESSKAKVETKQNNSGGLDVRVVDSMVAGAVGRRGSITDKALSQRKRLVPRGA
jgi:phage-related minor tail protein